MPVAQTKDQPDDTRRLFRIQSNIYDVALLQSSLTTTSCNLFLQKFSGFNWVLNTLLDTNLP